MAAELKAVREKETADLFSNTGYIDDEGWTRDMKGNIVEGIPRGDLKGHKSGGMVDLVKKPSASVPDPRIDDDMDGLENTVITKKGSND